MVLLDTQGLRLAGTLEAPDGSDVSDAVAAHLQGVSREASRAARLLDLGAWESVTAESPDGHLLVLPPTQSTVLLLLRDAQCTGGTSRSHGGAGRTSGAKLAGAARMRNLGEALERVTRVAGIRGAMLVAESDGLVVAEALAEGLDGAAVAALAASLTLRLRRTATSAGLAVPQVVQLRAERGTVLTVPAGDDLLLVAVAERDANLGLARLELRQAAAQLG